MDKNKQVKAAIGSMIPRANSASLSRVDTENCTFEIKSGKMANAMSTEGLVDMSRLGQFLNRISTSGYVTLPYVKQRVEEIIEHNERAASTGTSSAFAVHSTAYGHADNELFSAVWHRGERFLTARYGSLSEPVMPSRMQLLVTETYDERNKKVTMFGDYATTNQALAYMYRTLRQQYHEALKHHAESVLEQAYADNEAYDAENNE